jgi:uncharacterized protein (DUF1015 family)
MSTVQPFAALRPKPELAARICELPYDVMSSEEARGIAAGNDLSFLHVSKPEIDLPTGTDLYAPEVYARGAANFDRLKARGAIVQDPQPRLYFYRQVMGHHSQTGLVAAFRCEEYLRGGIKKHELTRPDKEDDRVRHIETLNAQTGPVFLTYRAVPEIDALAAAVTRDEPDVDFTAADGVRHSSWVVQEDAVERSLVRAFAALPSLYIADGHHRCAAAARVYRARGGAGHSAFFLAVAFPHTAMQILPYNRALKDRNGMSPPELEQRLAEVCMELPPAGAAPSRKHEMRLYLEGRWRSFQFRSKLAADGTAAERLDVALLQRHVLGPIFGIADPRTSQRVSFVGGIRGTRELERLVDGGEYACAFSMFPTGIDDLMAVADAGEIMPPKSTWFEPKLRDGMFSHLL